MKIKGVGKGFIGFFAGVFCTLFVGAILVPMYGDYVDRAIVSNWTRNHFPNSKLSKNIEKRLLNKQPITAQLFTMNNAKISSGYINEQGEVFVKTVADGSVVLLKPRVNDNKVEWICFGGSDDDMPNRCKNDFDVIDLLIQSKQ